MFFASGLKTTGAQPLLWTTGLMAPEAYTLKAALDGWIAGESAVGTRERAAAAYAGEAPEPRPKALARAANDAADNLLIQYLLIQFTCPKGQVKDLDLSWPKS
jgi:hypothetical protein